MRLELGAAYPQVFSRGDPTIESMDWSALATSLHAGRRLNSQTEVVAVTWYDAGKIDQALQGRVPVRVFGPDPHGYAFEGNAGGLAGENALIVMRKAGAGTDFRQLSLPKTPSAGFCGPQRESDDDQTRCQGSLTFFPVTFGAAFSRVNA